MEDKIRRIMDDSTDYQTGEVDAEIAISKLLVLFDVSVAVCCVLNCTKSIEPNTIFCKRHNEIEP
mgnify:CR=1 FL=1|tara:strand:- start:226 stop:420 length:195 start_codon:yes stop_codon:yes gene_type:complete